MYDLIAVISGTIGITNNLLKFIPNLKNAKIEQEIASLIRELTKAEIEANNMIKYINDLEKRLQDDNTNPLKVDSHGVCFDNKNVPYCTGCYFNNSHKRIPLSKNAPNGVINNYNCPVCNQRYNTPN